MYQMIPSQWKNATITYLTDADLTAEVDLEKPYENMTIIVPALDSTTLVCWAAEKTGGTYYTVGKSQSVEAGTGSYIDVWPICGLQYIKIETGTDQTANRTFRVRGVRS